MSLSARFQSRESGTARGNTAPCGSDPHPRQLSRRNGSDSRHAHRHRASTSTGPIDLPRRAVRASMHRAAAACSLASSRCARVMPGQSGNPGGRPKGLTKASREHAAARNNGRGRGGSPANAFPTRDARAGSTGRTLPHHSSARFILSLPTRDGRRFP